MSGRDRSAVTRTPTAFNSKVQGRVAHPGYHVTQNKRTPTAQPVQQIRCVEPRWGSCDSVVAIPRVRLRDPGLWNGTPLAFVAPVHTSAYTGNRIPANVRARSLALRGSKCSVAHPTTDVACAANHDVARGSNRNLVRKSKPQPCAQIQPQCGCTPEAQGRAAPPWVSRHKDPKNPNGVSNTAVSKLSPITSRSAVIRTLSTSFGDWLLSQENTPVKSRPTSRRGATISYDFSSTFQYASLMNFDQLSILVVCSE